MNTMATAASQRIRVLPIATPQEGEINGHANLTKRPRHSSDLPLPSLCAQRLHESVSNEDLTVFQLKRFRRLLVLYLMLP